jgi:hypothetical protein
MPRCACRRSAATPIDRSLSSGHASAKMRGAADSTAPGVLHVSHFRSRGRLCRISCVPRRRSLKPARPCRAKQVKEETKAAQKAGELTPAGGGEAPKTKSTQTGKKMTKEQRKAETKEAKERASWSRPGEEARRKVLSAQQADDQGATQGGNDGGQEEGRAGPGRRRQPGTVRSSRGAPRPRGRGRVEEGDGARRRYACEDSHCGIDRDRVLVNARISVLAAACAASLCVLVWHSPRPARPCPGEVKAETRAAEKAGQLTPRARAAPQ